jgi:hypothetical protein
MNTPPIHSKIVRIGNSRGVRIPRSLLEQAGLKDEERTAFGNDIRWANDAVYTRKW